MKLWVLKWWHKYRTAQAIDWLLTYCSEKSTPYAKAWYRNCYAYEFSKYRLEGPYRTSSTDAEIYDGDQLVAQMGMFDWQIFIYGPWVYDLLEVYKLERSKFKRAEMARFSDDDPFEKPKKKVKKMSHRSYGRIGKR